MNIIRKINTVAFSLIFTFIIINTKPFGLSVSAAGAAPYFSVKSTSEIEHLSTVAVNAEYNRGYYMAPEKNLEKVYKITVTQAGYLTFTANNPYKSIYNTTLTTVLGLVDSSGNCLWYHNYDFNYESSELHSYRIGLDTGEYYFYLKNNNHF